MSEEKEIHVLAACMANDSSPRLVLVKLFGWTTLVQEEGDIFTIASKSLDSWGCFEEHRYVMFDAKDNPDLLAGITERMLDMILVVKKGSK